MRLTGLQSKRIRRSLRPVYYAFKQTETRGNHGTTSTGWGDLSRLRIPCRFGRYGYLADQNGATERTASLPTECACFQHCAFLSEACAELTLDHAAAAF